MSSIKVLRHEIKFVIDKSTMYNIRDKLKEVLEIDRNIDGYNVRSLYFDSINDIDYQEKQDGAISRKKIRMRIYNANSNDIKLEIKQKYDVHQLKESLMIDRKTALAIIDGRYDVLLNYDDEVAKKIYLIMRQNCYVPKNIIEYKRIAFLSKNDTRITFDYDIKSIRYSRGIFFEENINYLDVTSSNEAVMEVKYNHFLENYINCIIQKYTSNKQSVSKYVMGRNKE